MNRILLRADNWRFRAIVADTGRYPTDKYLIADMMRGGKHYGHKINEPLPGFGYGGYPYAYMVVYGNVGRNDWDVGGDILCADCAEQSPPELGDDWAYLTLRQANAEITGYNDCRVIRCDGCGAILHDYETVTLDIFGSDGFQSSETYFASELDKALSIAREESAYGLVSIVRDAERHLDGYGDPIETVAAFAPLRHMPLPSARQYPLFIV